MIMYNELFESYILMRIHKPVVIYGVLFVFFVNACTLVIHYWENGARRKELLIDIFLKGKACT